MPLIPSLEEQLLSKEEESWVLVIFSICGCSADTLTSLLQFLSPEWTLPKTPLSSQNRIFDSLKYSIGNRLTAKRS